MKRSKAIVTLAIGHRYRTSWRRFCEANWRQYTDKHGYDLICIEEPLDSSARASQRSPAWQKCLILSQSFAREYERVVWLDADILINSRAAPCVVDAVPVEKAGAVEVFSEPKPELNADALRRMYEYWGPVTIANYSPEDYYRNWGLPGGFDKVLSSGTLVLSPAHHREILEHVYYGYEEKGGPEWNLEMRPLGYELQKAGVVHWIDHRFVLNWYEYRFLYYPFLIDWRVSPSLPARLRREVGGVPRG